MKIIDTPGIGDTRGIKYDKENLLFLLNFISQYKQINAIFILMKPNQSKLNAQFKYCILELLKFLNKSAADNIIFVFTNARGTDYQLGDTGPVLNYILKEIREKPPHVNIELKKKEIKYFFDNESFRYLMKVANKIKVNERFNGIHEESWKVNLEECARMFE